MRDVEREVHRPRYRAVIREDNPFLPGVSSDEWAKLPATTRRRTAVWRLMLF